MSWAKFTGAKESSHSVSLPGLQRALSRAISVTLHLLCLRGFLALLLLSISAGLLSGFILERVMHGRNF